MLLQLPPSLRHRRFRLLWLGLMISVAGSQMQVWALFWHIRELTPDPIALGGIGLARILPVVIFSLIGGAIADVLNRRRRVPDPGRDDAGGGGVGPLTARQVTL
jgi:hypothetical protein